MSTENRGGFLHRWSRRKIEAREGSPSDDDRPQQETPATDAAAEPAAKEPITDESSLRAPVAPPAEAGSERDGGGAEKEAPPLTLQDVQALTRDSDFAPFVTRQVAPEVKNAALKKLFSDPHYNVMDGLDIYIDDYSNLEPLPAPMLRRMVSAQALKMFDAASEDCDASSRAGDQTADAGVQDGEPARATGQAEMEDGAEIHRPQVASEPDPALTPAAAPEVGSAAASPASETKAQAAGDVTRSRS